MNLLQKSKYFLLFTTFLLSLTSYAQFTVSATPTPQFCIGDGAVQIDIENTSAGAVFEFLIFELPSNNLVRTTNGVIAPSSNFTQNELNLPAGNYALEVNEDIAGTITQQNTTFTIGNNFQPIVFNIVIDCTVNITANVTQGNPSTYELRDTDNNLLVGPQASNVFNALAAGTYNVVVTDVCGNTTGQSVTITPAVYDFENDTSRLTGYKYLASCDLIDHEIRILRNGTTSFPSEVFPIDVVYTVTGPGGAPVETFNATLNSNADNFSPLDLTFYYGQDFTISRTLTDACGISHTETDIITDTELTFSISKPAATCGQQFLNIFFIWNASPNMEIEFTAFPTGFDASDYNPAFTPGTNIAVLTENPSNQTGTFFQVGSSTQGLPDGAYTVKITDECGNFFERTTNVASTDPILRLRNQYPGCDDDEGSVHLQITNPNGLQQSGEIITMLITVAPASFPFALPFDVTSNIDATNGNFYMNGLPLGDYTFEAGTTCGPLTSSFELLGKEADYSSSKNFVCGSFDIDVELTSRYGRERIYLQRFDTALNQWVHPLTGVPYNEGDVITNSTASQLALDSGASGLFTISGGLTNITTFGEFRVLIQSNIFSNGSVSPQGNCIEVVETFTANPGGLTINDFAVVSCIDNTYNLVIDAVGLAPLNFEIIQKDGVAISVDNGTDPVFINLDEGTYLVRVSDVCGNSQLLNVLVFRNKLPTIQTEELCDGQNGRLFIQGFSFLNIEWFKDGISTGVFGNSLNFTPYNVATDIGLYEARLTYPTNPSSCVDNFISINLTVNSESNPNAGTGQSVSLSQSTINPSVNLFDYITGPFDAFGTWTETTAAGESGLLVGNDWFGSLASPGVYTFEYSVNGTCTNTDMTTVTIELLGAFCTKPGDFTAPGSESKVGISTYLSKQEGWPTFVTNGFIALESNTKGFVISRVQNAGLITDAKEGMLIYDIDANCVKLHNGTDWNCIQRGCNE